MVAQGVAGAVLQAGDDGPRALANVRLVLFVIGMTASFLGILRLLLVNYKKK